MQLRPYQLEAIQRIVAARKRGVRRMLVALPTGAGKTVIFSELIALSKYDVLVLAHRDELLNQAQTKIEAALRRRGDLRRVDIERGGDRASQEAQVVVASIRSLHEDRIGQALAGRNIRLVIYDECHHAVAKANHQVLSSIGAFDPNWPGTLVGFTATTRRADGVALGEIFEEIVAERTLEHMIEDGYLRPLRGTRINTQVSIENVPSLDDDFDLETLEETVNIESRNQLVAQSIAELCRDRRTIAFCVGVRHAEDLCQTLNQFGVPSGIVCGEMPKADREKTLLRFREGQLKVITNVGVLTEGFDDPGVSAIAMARPTRSESLYLQCVGRGMRLSPEASECLVLDFVDLSNLSIVTTATLEAGQKPPAPPERAASDSGSGQRPSPLIEEFPEAPLTLDALTQRLSAFDPLTMARQKEADAISPNAWLSLGTQGMILYFQSGEDNLCYFEILPTTPSGYQVWLEEQSLARFPTVQAAIEAVDYELAQGAYGTPESALPEASWRLHPVTEPLRAALDGLTPPRKAQNVGEAMAHLALERALQTIQRGQARR